MRSPGTGVARGRGSCDSERGADSAMRSILGLAIGVASGLIAVSSMPATAWAQPEFAVNFASGEQIYCTSAGALACGHTDELPAGAICLAGGPAPMVRLGRKGPALELFDCADEGTYGAGMPELRKGRRWRSGPYRCRRTVHRVRCWTDAGHGFVFRDSGRLRSTGARARPPRRCPDVAFAPGYGGAASVRAFGVACEQATRVAGAEGQQLPLPAGWSCRRLNPDPGSYRTVCFRDREPARQVRYVELD